VCLRQLKRKGDCPQYLKLKMPFVGGQKMRLTQMLFGNVYVVWKLFELIVGTLITSNLILHKSKTTCKHNLYPQFSHTCYCKGVACNSNLHFVDYIWCDPRENGSGDLTLTCGHLVIWDHRSKWKRETFLPLKFSADEADKPTALIGTMTVIVYILKSFYSFLSQKLVIFCNF